MIANLRGIIYKLCDDLLVRLRKLSPNDYILFLTRGHIMPGLEKITTTQSNYVLDYSGDLICDETRIKFYVDYLNKNYRTTIYDYSDEDGFYNLNVELMIYCHVWESTFFLKNLKRITDILTGRRYDWALEVPEYGIKRFIKDEIINPLLESGDEFGNFLRNAYSPNLRNSFAHSMYHIDMRRKEILLYNKNFDKSDEVSSRISYDCFQKKFLNSIILCNYLHNSIEKNRISIASGSKHAVTRAFRVPCGRMMQIMASTTVIHGKEYPEFQGVFIKNYNPRFNVGDWVLFECLETPIEIDRVINLKEEQFVHLKGTNKMCSSKMLAIASPFLGVDNNCPDYQVIRKYLE